jgi:GPH family glycoside/pentoside/hexuronide:cation symporter
MGWLAGMALPAIAFIGFFGSTEGIDGRLVAEHYPNFGLLCALLTGIATIVCIVGTRSAIPRLPQYKSNVRFSWRDPLNDFKLVFKNRNLRLSMGAGLAYGLAYGVIFTLNIYLGTYFWELSANQMAGSIFPAVLATIVAFITINHLGRRFEKPYLLATLTLALGVNSLWLLGGRLLGILPENGDNIIYPLFLLSAGIAIFLLISVQVLGASLLADIVDEQELDTGERKEAVIFASNTFVMKTTTGAGGLIAGIIIDLSEITSSATPGIVAQSSLQTLGSLACFIPAILAAIAFLFYRRLRCSRSDHAKIRAELDAINT